MPEIPDLEAIRTFLEPRIVGVPIKAATVRIPVVVRASKEDFAGALEGNHIRGISRIGKFLLFDLDHDLVAAVNPMLTGRFQYLDPADKMHKKTSFIIDFEDGKQLRYYDDLLMGKLYLATPATLKQLPRFADMGPDALAISKEEFRERIRKYTGMVKNVLTNEKFIAGVGNAYSDEILWEAGFHPYRKRSSIDAEGIDRLYDATRKVLLESIPVVTEKMKEGLDYTEWRGHLKVHRKGGQTCPRCGGRISEITAGNRITNFCRTCQPMY
ncbi:MAG: DNA-formamidopyrimidine glycosylase family protein [Dehalococcoidia bacterium]